MITMIMSCIIVISNNYCLSFSYYNYYIKLGAIQIGKTLSANKTIQTLEMGHNNIGDDGISVIIKELQHNNTLIKLKVQKCGFSSKGRFIN